MITLPTNTSVSPYPPATPASPDVPQPAFADLPAPGLEGPPSPARFDDLFGAPPLLQVKGDATGAGAHKATPKSAADPLAGATLPGQNGVVVQRSIGDPRGYDSKYQAIAWARAIQSDRAMVVLGKDHRWHAVETNTVAHDAAGGKGPVQSATQIGKVDPARYEQLRKDAMQGNDRAQWRTFAAYALGVPESEINVIGKGETPSSTQININLSPDFKAEGRTANFDPKTPTWIQLGPAAFDRPANAAATLAHEAVHARHRDYTLERYAQYESTPHGRQSFREWVANQAKGKGGDAYWKAEIAAGYQDGHPAATELEAHVEAARVAFASGDLTQAKTDLTKVATLPVLPKITTPNADLLRALRDSLAGDARAVFDTVATKASALSIFPEVRKR